MDHLEIILEAISVVRDDIKDVKDDVTQRLDDHEKRIRSSERAVLQFKTLGSAISTIAVFLGWDFVKHHVLKQ